MEKVLLMFILMICAASFSIFGWFGYDMIRKIDFLVKKSSPKSVTEEAKNEIDNKEEFANDEVECEEEDYTDSEAEYTDGELN